MVSGRLRMVSNFPDGDSGVGEIYTRAWRHFQGTRSGTRRDGSVQCVSSRKAIFVGVCISPKSPKLEATMVP